MAGLSTVAARPAFTVPKAVVAVAWGVVRWLPLIAFLALWEGVARSGAVTTFMLPSITLVVERIWTDAVEGDLAVSLGLTLYRTLVGFFIASAGGIVLGILIARSRGITPTSRVRSTKMRLRVSSLSISSSCGMKPSRNVCSCGINVGGKSRI